MSNWYLKWLSLLLTTVFRNTMRFLIFTVMILFCFNLCAQEIKDNLFTVAYFAPYSTQYGGKLGYSYTLEKWEKVESSKIKSFYIHPQIGVFARRSNHTSIIFNTDFGYKSRKVERKFYLATSISLGYLAQSQITSSSVNLGTGEIQNRQRQWRGYFLPTINYEFGKEVKRHLGWYFKFSLGRKISSKLENSAFFGAELGLKISLINKESE